MTGTYHDSYVVLSILIAIIASYTALDLIEKVSESKGYAKKLWQAGGSITMGIGIWSMHFTGILALDLPIPVSYDVELTLCSLFMAIGASYLAFQTATPPKKGQRIRLIGLLVGIMIASMHYSGIAAMEMRGMIKYNLFYVGLYFSVAVVASTLFIHFFQKGTHIHKLLTSMILGLGMSLLHYGGMLSISFIPFSFERMDLRVFSSGEIGTDVVICTFIILFFALVSSFIDRQMAIRAAKWGEMRYQSLFEHNPDGMFTIDKIGNILRVNPEGERITGYSGEELLHGPFYSLLDPSESKKIKMYFEQALLGETKVFEATCVCKDGNLRSLVIKMVPKIMRQETLGVYMITKDITDQKKAERALKESEERYRLITDNSQDMINLVDKKGSILYASPSHQSHFGLVPEEYIGKHITEGIHPEDLELFSERLFECITSYENFTIEFRRQHKNGQWIWTESKGTLVFDEKGDIQHIVFTTRNIMERKQYEEKLERLAYYDPLTGLPNRRFFKQSLEQAIKEAERYQRNMAIMFMDLDRFKWINDTLGHDVGDELLERFAQRVKNCLRDSDIIGRFGGDEFTVLLPEIQNQGDVNIVAERIIESLQDPWVIGEHYFQTTSSIGISLYPRDGQELNLLVKRADIALYQAKELGRNNYQMFNCEGIFGN